MTQLRRPLRLGGARIFRGVAERAVAVVEKQPIGADIADVDVGEAVVVDVADGDALAEAVLDECRSGL